MSSRDQGGVKAEATGIEMAGLSGPRLSASHDRSDSLDEGSLKGNPSGRRLAETGARNDADAGDSGSEHELLLMDPNLPDDEDDEYAGRRRSHPEAGDEFSDTEPLSGRRGAAAEDSPYPEVRAAVKNTDDEDLPCNTVRAWSIGLILVVLGAAMNTLFSLRQPSISIGALVAQIIAWPIGHAWARYLPDKRFSFFGIPWSLNPGPFNIKEHAIIVVMASVAFSVAYATDIILAQLVFYKQNFGISFQLLLTVSTQSLGYGIAGMMRKFLG
jgi:OPT oligopeptide transporter protein